jgi:hypothetical protein
MKRNDIIWVMKAKFIVFSVNIFTYRLNVFINFISYLLEAVNWSPFNSRSDNLINISSFIGF